MPEIEIDKQNLKSKLIFPAWLFVILFVILLCGNAFFATLWMVTRINLERAQYDCYGAVTEVLIGNEFNRRITETHCQFEEMTSSLISDFKEISDNALTTFSIIQEKVNGNQEED